jgi:hypothetical protein
MEYYSLDPLLSRGAKLNFVIGDRGAGKTYDFKRLAFESWERTGAEWVYIRRNSDEIIASKGSLWDDYLPEKGYQTKTKGYKCFIRIQIPMELEGKEKSEWEEKNPWRPFGYFIALTDAQMFKSASFPKVDKICFDEFIIENKRHRYIPGEVDQFMGLIDTIARQRKIRVVALSNAGFINNPYFIYYGIKGSEFEETNFLRRHEGAVLFEYYNSKLTDEELENLNMAKIAGESYKKYAIRSKFKDGGEDLVRTKPLNSHPWIKLSRNGDMWLTVYKKTGENWWVGFGNSKVDGYSLNKWEVFEGATYDNQLLNDLKDALNDRVINFEDARVRSIFLEWLKERQL